MTAISPVIVGIACVRDEADIIESFVRHNLLFVDRLYVVDNLSSDATEKILLALRDEGLPLRLYSSKDITHQQESIIASILNSLANAERSIEFSVLLDADEFIAAESRESFLHELRTVPEGHVPVMAWKSYIPKFESPPNSLMSERICYRREPEGTVQFKSVVPRVLFGRCLVSPGNHFIGTEATGKSPPHLITSRLAHIPVRSREQVLAKLLLHSHTLSMKRNRQAGEGKHWDLLATTVRAKHYELSDQEFVEIALRYGQSSPDSGFFSVVFDPLVTRASGDLRYPDWGRVSLIERFDRYISALITRFHHEASDKA